MGIARIFLKRSTPRLETAPGGVNHHGSHPIEFPDIIEPGARRVNGGPGPASLACGPNCDMTGDDLERPCSGLLNLDKPTGVTSRDVVDMAARAFRGLKVGHAGTLDPLASGVLVVCVGKATRLIEYVQRMP